MRQMTYPDGEVLTYAYDNGGLLKEAHGTKRGNKYPYIKGLQYDEYGQRTSITYGNNVVNIEISNLFMGNFQPMVEGSDRLMPLIQNIHHGDLHTPQVLQETVNKIIESKTN